MRLFRFLCIVLLVAVQDVAANHLMLKNISIPDGLSNMNITSFAQDDLGYIWIGTRRGLNRYNGYEFTHFYNDVDDNNSLYSNNINKVYCAKNGLIFIGTSAGINVYDTKSDQIKRLFPNYFFTVVDIKEYNEYIYVATSEHGLFRFQLDTPVLEQVGDNWVTGYTISTIHIDKEGRVWLSLLNGEGLAFYDDHTRSFQYYTNEQNECSPFCNSVLWIHELSNDILMLGTESGLTYFDPSSRDFIELPEFKLFAETLRGKEIRFVFQFRDNEFLAGSNTDGLFSYYIDNKSITNYYENPDLFNISYSNTYNTYFIDQKGNLWLGTFDKGIHILPKQTKNINFDNDLNSLFYNEFVTCISKDHDNRLIIATRKNGFYIYDPKTKDHRMVGTHNSDLAYPYLRSLLVDSYNRYWMGSGYYLQVYENTENRSFQSSFTSLLYSPIVCLHQQDEMIFAGTESQGIWVFDLQGNVLFHSNSLGANITDITKYNDHEILFSSYGFGLHTMNIRDFSTKKIDIPGLANFPGTLSAITLFYDQEGKIWIGTYNHGLIMIDIVNTTIKSFGVKDGLPSSDVVGIEEDDFGALWLSTSFGLARFDKSSLTVKTFSYKDGLNNYQFHEKASYKDDDGIIFFGGNNGLTYFNPADIKEIDSIPPVLILDELHINNVRVSPSSCDFLKQSITYTDGITLSHRERIFSIGYVAFDYYNSDNLQYYYMLEGFDENWNYAGSQRRISYSNLRRGSYTFRVKVINDEGMWSELPNSLQIKVKPAPWFSYFAWVLYVSVVIMIVIMVSRMYIKSILVKKKLELEQVEHRRDLEINDMKRRFFTNIAHEFRTPLTMLGAIFKQLRIYEETPLSIKEYIQTAGLNVERLLKLVNQLLAFKMMESEVLHLWVKESNLNKVVESVIKDVSVLAMEKDVKIQLFEDSEFLFYFDADIVEKILINLLSNAVKHSSTGGKIEVMLNKLRHEEVVQLYDKRKMAGKSFVKEYIEVSVIDHGKGVDPDKLNQIFDRYIKSEANPNRIGPDHSSIGIGLNFSRKLVELHKGFIRVDSIPGKGATFSFVIPYDSTAFNTEAFAKPVGPDHEALQEVYIPVNPNNGVKPNLKKTVLIIEDDPQLNSFLRKAIGKYYRVLVAYNGEEGLDLIKKKNPDVIVSDIVMPNMSGLELLKKVRESDEHCHLSVILLSSKSEIRDQIEGLKIGADSYIPKPFDIDYLIHTIDSQLINRGRIHEIFLKGKIPELKEYEGNQVAMNFIARLDKILEENLSNSELDITFIAEKMNTSRSSFYRKFLCMTNLTPISYIRKYRIQKSIELLTKTDLSIQIVSDMVGFSSPSYFSRAFKQEKHASPKEYIAQLKMEQSPT
jgi:signal transduction histidine kinase/ligand-binding sensor domain-containing protein/DNA-binding response OmpR family regulator